MMLSFAIFREQPCFVYLIAIYVRAVYGWCNTGNSDVDGARNG